MRYTPCPEHRSSGGVPVHGGSDGLGAGFDLRVVSTTPLAGDSTTTQLFNTWGPDNKLPRSTTSEGNSPTVMGNVGCTIRAMTATLESIRRLAAEHTA